MGVSEPVSCVEPDVCGGSCIVGSLAVCSAARERALIVLRARSARFLGSGYASRGTSLVRVRGIERHTVLLPDVTRRMYVVCMI